jgi:hypothetical protein
VKRIVVSTLVAAALVAPANAAAQGLVEVVLPQASALFGLSHSPAGGVNPEINVANHVPALISFPARSGCEKCSAEPRSRPVARAPRSA